MHWERWQRVAALLDHHRIRPMIAVIPDNRDESLFVNPARADFWDVAREWEQKGWTIGLHGYQHRYVTRHPGLVPISDKSEFAGLALPIQQEKIRKGWEVLLSHRLKPSVWIAPSHSFDANTLLALKRETDINLISDGIALNCFEDGGFYWIPQQLWRFHRMPFGTYTICLHPNNMSARAMGQLEVALGKHRPRFINVSDLAFSPRSKNRVEKALAAVFFFRANRRHP
jgi:predicted deacetylase